MCILSRSALREIFSCTRHIEDVQARYQEGKVQTVSSFCHGRSLHIKPSWGNDDGEIENGTMSELLNRTAHNVDVNTGAQYYRLGQHRVLSFLLQLQSLSGGC